MYAYRKTTVKALCLASIESNLVAMLADVYLFEACPIRSPMALWSFTGHEPNYMHLYIQRLVVCNNDWLEFQGRDTVPATWMDNNCIDEHAKLCVLFLSFLFMSHCACIFLDSPQCPWDKLHSASFCRKSLIFFVYSRACIILSKSSGAITNARQPYSKPHERLTFINYFIRLIVRSSILPDDTRCISTFTCPFIMCIMSQAFTPLHPPFTSGWVTCPGLL